MDVNTFAQLIGSVGFPIAACCVMFWQNTKLQETLKDIAVAMQKMSDEMDRLSDDLTKEV